MTSSVAAELERTNLSEWGAAIGLSRPIVLNRAHSLGERVVRPRLLDHRLAEQFLNLTGHDASTCQFKTRVFDYTAALDDCVAVSDADSGLPLIVRSGADVIVNFDIGAARAYRFADSKRPVYTYLPWFNIQRVPEGLRRPVSNWVQGLRARHRNTDTDVVRRYQALPLTNFEFVVLLLNVMISDGRRHADSPFRWPSGRRAAFVSFHDVDTPGFLKRGDRDALLRLEQKYDLRSTWFIPSKFVNRHQQSVDRLIAAGHEVGWHGHNHDHRDHVGRFAVIAVEAFGQSRLNRPSNFPIGMRAPRLLTSEHLFEQIERRSQLLQYDTSFCHGIVPYPLWLRNRQSTILEIPTTVPTDIRLYNEIRGVSQRDRLDLMLKAQIARTERIIEVGGLVSIVTHPESSLSERSDFLAMYDQYLAYVKSRTDVWFTTTGEVFKHWTSSTGPSRTDKDPATRSQATTS